MELPPERGEPVDPVEPPVEPPVDPPEPVELPEPDEPDDPRPGPPAPFLPLPPEPVVAAGPPERCGAYEGLALDVRVGGVAGLVLAGGRDGGADSVGAM